MSALLAYTLSLVGTLSTGSDEGMNAWVAANYALSRLGGDPNKTDEIVELGALQLRFSDERIYSFCDSLLPEHVSCLNTVHANEFLIVLYNSEGSTYLKS